MHRVLKELTHSIYQYHLRIEKSVQALRVDEGLISVDESVPGSNGEQDAHLSAGALSFP